MADAFGGLAAAVSGINQGLGGSVVGLLMVLQLPLLFTWFVLTVLIIWLFIARRSIFIKPWDWKYEVTMIRPFAGLKPGIFHDKGALCKEDGITRFKLKKEDSVMQRPDTTDFYPNGEYMVLSLGREQKASASRKIDYEKRVVLISVENLKVAKQYWLERVIANRPDWILDHWKQAALLVVCWVLIGVTTAVSNLLTVFPFFVASLIRLTH